MHHVNVNVEPCYSLIILVVGLGIYFKIMFFYFTLTFNAINFNALFPFLYLLVFAFLLYSFVSLLSLYLGCLFNPLKPELNPVFYLLALLGAHHFLHVSGRRVKSLNLRLLMSYIYIYMEHPFLMFLDHTQRRSTVGRTPLDE